jgi:capsule biosynthesis phosphatase
MDETLAADEGASRRADEMPLRVAIDLDGTICELKQRGQSYADVLPLPGAVDRLRRLRAQGCYIIIMTARNMQTCDANLGLVMKNVGKMTLDWLETHGIEYDEIYFGKANAHVYIDDRAHRFRNWDEVTAEMLRGEARAQ